jgi:uncharacterized damage-inducible protein DinB
MPATTRSHSKEQFLAVYEDEHLRTMRVLQAFPEEQLDYRPHPRAKTARELAWVFVMGRSLGAMLHNDAFATEGPTGTPPPAPASWFELLSALEKAHKDYGDLIRSTPDEKMWETVRFFVAPQKMGDIPRMNVCWFLLHDQIHHRGQFSTYLRLVDAKVPSIYGPSADEPWM